MNGEGYVVLRSSAPAGFEGRGMAPMSPPDVAVEVIADKPSRAQQAELEADPEVLAAAPSMPMKLVEPLEVEPSAARPAGDAAWGVEAVGATKSSFDGSGITVAVLDTGIAKDHPAFAGVEIVQRNFTTEADEDIHGHGTHCAGTIFGQDVDGVRIGIARGIERALIGKVLGAGGGSSANITEAINWAVEQGAHVISMSLGVDFPGAVNRMVRQGADINAATSIALEEYRANIDLFRSVAELVRDLSAFRQGTIIVAASGNESRRPRFEIAVAPPAAGAGIVAVGAVAERGNEFPIAPFSNTKADLVGPGVAITSAGFKGGLAKMDGTSMATPHVAGVAALWAQSLLDNGKVSVEELRARLIGNSDTSGMASGFDKTDFGAGLVKAPA